MQKQQSHIKLILIHARPLKVARPDIFNFYFEKVNVLKNWAQ